MKKDIQTRFKTWHLWCHNGFVMSNGQDRITGTFPITVMGLDLQSALDIIMCSKSQWCPGWGPVIKQGDQYRVDQPSGGWSGFKIYEIRK